MSVFRRIQVGEYIFESAQDGIVAKAGGGQTSAFQLSAELNRIATCATVGDSVMLPPAQPGMTLCIINHGAQPCQVFGQPGDTINDVATATGVSQMQNSTVFYFCLTAGQWYTEGLASGFASGLATFSSTDSITAFAGGGQTNAVLLGSMQNRVTTVGTAADSVRLPPAKRGMEITVINAAASNSMNVFPSSQAQGGVSGGDSINALAQNAAFAVAAGKVATFYCCTDGIWHSILSA
jgi:hypothetical protein